MKWKTVIMVVLFGLAAAACGPGPAGLAAQFQEAVNAADREAALALLAEDVTWQTGWGSSLSGKPEVEDWLAVRFALRFQVDGTPAAEDGSAAIPTCAIHSDMWQFLGVNQLPGSCRLDFEGELITNFTFQPDQSTRAVLADLAAVTTEDLPGIWVTRNYITDSGDLYLQLMEGGSAFLTGSIVEPGSDYDGARLIWSYEDHLLTIQNDGPAAEKYCPEGEVGVFLVREVDQGGLFFNTVLDACSLRGVAFELPPRWRPYEP